MSDDVVTKLTIDSDTSGADAYASAMDRAGEATERTLGSSDGLSLKIAGVSIGFVAAAAAIKQGVDYVVDFNKQLADIETVANRVGLSLSDFQAIQFGGQIAGLSDNQINAGLEKSSMLLNDAQRNANSLAKLFDQNGISIRNVNGQLLTENQLLGIAADLVSRASNPRDATAVAQMLGFTKEWVPLLQQGSAAIAGLGDEASRAGAVIDDATIQKASEFDAQWRRSSVEFSTYMRAALAGLMPLVDDLIQGAGKFVKGLDRNKIEAAVNDQLAASGIPNEGGIKVDASGLIDGVSAMKNTDIFTSAFWMELGRAFSSGVKIDLLGPEEVKWFNGVGALTGGGAGFSDARSRFAAQAPFQAAADSFSKFDAGLSNLTFGGATKIPGADQGKDAVDRAIDSLRKHSEQQEADAKAVGLGEAALARFRAEAAETAAVQANGGKETAAQARQFAELRDKAAAAAGALAQAKIDSQISFGRQTAFLTPQDVAIAQQLASKYGNDVPKALESAEAAQLRFNNTMKDGAQAFQNAAAPALLDFEMGAKSGADAIRAFEQQFARSILNMINQMLIFQPIARAFQSGFNGFSLFGAPAAATVTSAMGNVFDSGRVVRYALGGVPDMVDSPTLAPMAMFGEAGPEAIMPLKRGADGSLGVASSSKGGDTHIHYNIDASGADSGTVARIQKVLQSHAQAIGSQGKAISSAQYMQATGVNRG